MVFRLWRGVVLCLAVLLACIILRAAEGQALTTAQRRAKFHALLDRDKVPLNPTSQANTDGENTVERGQFFSEAGQAVPFLLYRPTKAGGLLPAVVVLHGTGGNKEGESGLLKELSARGFVAIAIDGRYHGARIPGGAHGTKEYNEAIFRAWQEPDDKKREHPFYFDTVYDVWRTIDYLLSRKDVDGKRIGLVGFSKGGIETWLAAATDERIKVAVPAIGVQSLRWSLENEQWQGRANTIHDAHAEVARALGEPEINAKVCRALWTRVVPGILDEFDCPQMLTAIAPRPLLILNGEKDPNNPLGGAKLAFAAAQEAYHKSNADNHLEIDVAPNIGHAVTVEQHQKMLAWLVRWLNAGGSK